MKKILNLWLFLFFYYSIIYAQSTIDLKGNWKVQLDSNHVGIQKNGIWHNVNLPGSLAENKLGKKTVGSDFGILTPTHKFIGVAWYQKEIEIPKNFKNKEIILFLERVLWESTVYLDGKEMNKQDALGTPHIHPLGVLKPGKHQLTIRVNNDMIHNIGDKGHAYSDYTQSIWNGIVGKIVLQAKDKTHFKSIRTFPDIDKDLLKVSIEIKANKAQKSGITLEIRELKTGNIVKTFSIKKKLNEGINQADISIPLNHSLKKWSEFKPNVYTLNAFLKTRKYKDQTATEFGFVKISHNKHHVLINDQPVFLRGNLDCVHFPLTGYPSTKIEDWENIFKIYKDYGLNHVRFHSWCPPEAAFKAANRIGIYIQAEASIWIDWWMSIDMKAKGRPEMDTKGHPKGVGKDPVRDRFVVAEMNRVVDFYGNHPSFTMFCIGNELGNGDFDVMSKWIGDLKQKDPRRLYAASTARIITPSDDYSATHYIKGKGRTRGLNGATTDWDFEKVYSQMDIPIIAHEIGQWPVYPVWSEIDKYKGVLKARNFEEFRAMAQKNGIDDQDANFRKASGALNQILYKYETESFLRTKSCAGVQLLSMQDYQGQGEALIGWLDAFWDSKGITSPQKFKAHYDETVPLLRVKKFVWKNDEVLNGSIQLSHFGKNDLQNALIELSITSPSGELLFQKKYPFDTIKTGTLTNIGQFIYPLNKIEKATRLHIEISLEETHFKNSWNVWAYPTETPEIENADVLVTEQVDKKMVTALESGKSVLLLAHNLGDDSNSVAVDFYPLYWSLTFFPGQGKTSIGTLIKDKHPLFKDFPTSYHSDWQWETLRQNTKGFILNDLPKDYKPIVQVVDDFHRNNKEGLIFEFKVGKGKLLVCGYNITDDKLPVAQQLKYSLLRYMKSDDFSPILDVDVTYLKALFPSIPKAKMLTFSDGFKNVVIEIDAAAKLKESQKSLAWDKKYDDVRKTNKDILYKVVADGIWKDEHVTSWHGKNMKIELQVPQGMLGTLNVQFNDWNQQKREGILEFEGRKAVLKNHEGEKGKWIQFHVMREDSNDGKLLLKTRATKGGNLMISKIVLVKD